MKYSFWYQHKKKKFHSIYTGRSFLFTSAVITGVQKGEMPKILEAFHGEGIGGYNKQTACTCLKMQLLYSKSLFRSQQSLSWTHFPPFVDPKKCHYRVHRTCHRDLSWGRFIFILLTSSSWDLAYKRWSQLFVDLVTPLSLLTTIRWLINWKDLKGSGRVLIIPVLAWGRDWGKQRKPC
jgi:hypothetical protein